MEKERLNTQQCLNKVIAMDLFPERFPELTEDQIVRLRDTLDVIEQALDDVADILQSGQEQTAGGMGMVMGP